MYQHEHNLRSKGSVPESLSLDEINKRNRTKSIKEAIPPLEINET